MTEKQRLADFYRWLEAQDGISVGRDVLSDAEVQRLVQEYLAGREFWPKEEG